MQPSTTTAGTADRLLACASIAAGLDVAAAVWLFTDPGPARWMVAATLHALAIAVSWINTRGPRSQRGLVTALVATLPVLGPAVGVLAMVTPRRGEIAVAPPEPRAAARVLTVADVRRLTDGLSAFEALQSRRLAERDATVAMLVRRADATSVALLERAVAGDDPDLAVEAALALEDLSLRREPVTS